MIGKRQEVINQEFSARRFHMGRRHTARKLYTDIQDGFQSAIEEELDAFGTQHICNLVRIANDCCNALRQYTPVKFVRRNMRGFNVKVRIDKSRHDDPPGNVDFVLALIVAECSHNPVTTDRDVTFDKLAGHEIEETATLQDDVSGFPTYTLIDHPFQHHITSYSESIIESYHNARRGGKVTLPPRI